jgi:hypothetical protein
MDERGEGSNPNGRTKGVSGLAKETKDAKGK